MDAKSQGCVKQRHKPGDEEMSDKSTYGETGTLTDGQADRQTWRHGQFNVNQLKWDSQHDLWQAETLAKSSSQLLYCSSSTYE